MAAKLAIIPVLLFVGCIVAGLYGALHNQITYTVSPEYFHLFKFEQFAIPMEFHDRIGAAMVGWMASWWMGLIIGIPLLLIGLVLPDWKTYLTRCSIAIALVTLTTLTFGLCALLFASLAPSALNEFAFLVPRGVEDKTAFLRAGAMHDAGYLGGLFGVVIGSIYLILAARRLKRAASRT